MFALGDKRPSSQQEVGDTAELSSKKHAKWSTKFSTLVLSALPRSELFSKSSVTSFRSAKHEHSPVASEQVETLQETKSLSCKCRRSKCLKQYCECYRAGEYCGANCECELCMNQEQHGEERQQAMEQTKRSSTYAFVPDWKALSTRADPEAKLTHPKGCRCRRSKCRKKYCECYQMAVPCSSKCECMNCHNKDLSQHRKKTARALHQLLLTPTRTMTEAAMESEEEEAEEPQRALDLEETLRRPTEESLEAPTPTTMQGDASMASLSRSPLTSSSLHRSPVLSRGVSPGLPSLSEQDTAYPIDMSVEASFSLSSSTLPAARSLCKSAVLAPAAGAVTAMLVDEASKFGAAGDRGAEGKEGAEDASGRNESIISLDSSMEGAISWSELDFCSSPSFMDLDSNF